MERIVDGMCPRCGNADPRFFGYLKGVAYCRKCISFRGNMAKPKEIQPEKTEAKLHFPLTKEQATLSRRLISNYNRGIDTLVYAVCGSGKTEISYGVIAEALSRGEQVGFAVPRRDVAIELYWRIKEAFPGRKTVAVYGGHTYSLSGDIIVLTTHQLYRYENYFDLLILDEIDAFPFKGNAVLQEFFRKSIRGHFVMMSATPSKAILAEFKAPNRAILELRTRFHRHKIPVPIVWNRPKILQFYFLVRSLWAYQKKRLPVFVFCPTIAEAETVYRILRVFVKNGAVVHSKREDREKSIKSLREGELSYLVTTSVLERGVTIKRLQVIIFHADEETIYDAGTLIQISGRAGRKIDAPTGDVYFLCRKETEAMRGAIREIRYSNTFLRRMLSRNK